MASLIPTRRTTRRADENAPPAASSRPVTARSRSTGLVPVTKPSVLSTIAPQIKRANSSTAPTDTKPPAGKPAAGKSLVGTKRSALGEVTNARGKEGKEGKDGKVGKEGVSQDKDEAAKKRAPLGETNSAPQTTIPARRTRASIAASNSASFPSIESIKDDASAASRRGAASRIPVPTRSRSTTASTSAAASTSTSTSNGTAKLRERKLNVQHDLVDPVPEPARKKRKTSSPALVIDDDELEDDLADEGLYDEDGQEVILSSGGRGTALRSPKARAKDHGWTDLDVEDEGDPTMVSEYVADAFAYMISIEKNSIPDPDYMSRQAELSWKMRTILMDWLIEVHNKFRLLPETLLIASNLVDRFLSSRVVSLQKLQLVGLTALFIASKYEEVICPSVTHFQHMADGGFGLEEILKAERYMLSTLDFDLSYPNPLHFLRRISKADGYDIQTRTLAKFLIELACLDEKLLKFGPSKTAAAAVWLARLCLERGEWTPNLIHYSTYAVGEILEAAQIMVNYLVDPALDRSTTFFKKYAAKKHMKSSVYLHSWAITRWPESASGKSEFIGRELEAEIEGLL